MRRLAACALLVVLLAGCREHTVSVAFQPEVGATYRYEVRVEATTATTLEGGKREVRSESVRLVAEHTVLDAGPDGVRVRVLVGEPGTVAQAFIVRFDRGAQLSSIESTEGAPADIVGALGVPELFPGAASAPPARALAPGERWHTSRRITVPGGSEPSRLTVDGRLAELGVHGDEDVAILTSTATLPFATTTNTADGVVALEGRQRITQRATYDLDDGAVRVARARTTGRFDLQVQPPAGTVAEPVPGTLEVVVTSTTRRLPAS